MANAWAPRIRWREFTYTAATVNGNANITVTAAQALTIEVGQEISGTGIPTGATILSINTATGVVGMSSNATATGSPSVTFRWEYQFLYPPRTDSEEQSKANNTVLTSLSGINQTQTFHVEFTRKVSFDFINKTDRDFLFEKWLKNWALQGKAFSYRDDETVGATYTYELESFAPSQARSVKKHPAFLYKFDLVFRRAETV